MFSPIPILEFRGRIGLPLNRFINGSITHVVAMRDITEAIEVYLMTTKYLRALIYSVPLEGGSSRKLYEGCEIHTQRIDPRALRIGQTFVEREKIFQQLERVPRVFARFPIYHGAKCNPMIVVGTVASGEIALAHYLPPIIEQHAEGLSLLDGVHRNFLTRAVGTTIESIVITGVRDQFPCRTHGWGGVRLVERKPPRAERYYGLQPELFRDLKHAGIDG